MSDEQEGKYKLQTCVRPATAMKTFLHLVHFKEENTLAPYPPYTGDVEMKCIGIVLHTNFPTGTNKCIYRSEIHTQNAFY